VSVDGVGVSPLRAWGGQLVRVAAGQHQIEQRLIPWDAVLGMLVSIASLAVVVGLLRRGRRGPRAAQRRQSGPETR
jgi:hypothetical protein